MPTSYAAAYCNSTDSGFTLAPDETGDLTLTILDDLSSYIVNGVLCLTMPTGNEVPDHSPINVMYGPLGMNTPLFGAISIRYIKTELVY